MVMETPGPQEVGREFVRQYYTMLHEAPLHLHRFYSNNSAFVHGGVEKAGNEQPPVIGQEAIHEKIVSLNFNDCHAKIRQVDSQSTVGDSVVVQVTGELSNNGEPMRRFMQTFVLVPQMPKKFYVHNDIFRYQDEVFHEEEGDPDESDRFITDPRADEPLENGTNLEPTSNIPQEVTSNIYDQVPLSNGTPHEVEQVETAEPQLPVASPPQVKPDVDVASIPEEPVVSEEPQTESDSYESSSETKAPANMEPSQPAYTEPQETRPFSWAALASKNTPVGMNIPPAASTYPAPSSHMSKPPRSSEPTRPESASTQAPQAQRAPRQPQEHSSGDSERSSGGRRDGDGDGDSVNGRRSNSAGGGGIGGMKYADNQQLFVGNLPLEITEKDLKKFFDGYGKVEDLRINTKSGGGRVPNFGFVVFEKPETVQEILRIKCTHPIKYNNEHRLNVEEKKPKGNDGKFGGGRGLPRGGMGGQGMGGGRSGAQYGNGRGGMKSGGFGRQDMRGSPNLGGPRGGGMSQGRR